MITHTSSPFPRADTFISSFDPTHFHILEHLQLHRLRVHTQAGPSMRGLSIGEAARLGVHTKTLW